MEKIKCSGKVYKKNLVLKNLLKKKENGMKARETL